MRARERLAAEAERYLDVVECFAALGADPHAEARARATRARVSEQSLRRARAGSARRRLFR